MFDFRIVQTVVFCFCILSAPLFVRSAPINQAAITETDLTPIPGNTSTTAPTPANTIAVLKISAGEWPPFLGENLPQQGTAAVLIRELLGKAGYQVEFHFLPWARAYRDTAAGRYDATAIWMFAENRLTDFLYSDAVLEEKFVLFHLKQQPLAWRTLGDLKNLQLGGGLGYSYGPAFDQALARGELKVTRVNTTEQNFRRLLAGRIDAFAEEIQVGYHVLQTLPEELVSQVTHHPTPLLSNQSFLLFPKQLPESDQLKTQFNQQLTAAKKSGRYTQFFSLAPAKATESKRKAKNQ